MNKLWNTLAILITAFTATAQDLARKIPHDAFAVVNIQTDHFFKLMSVEDFNHSTLGKAIVEKANESGFDGVESISDFGIALNRTSYFYTKLSDSVTYYSFLLPIDNVDLFEKHFGKDEAVRDNGSFKSFINEVSGDTIVFAWDNQMLSVASATLVNGYFAQADVAERYGIRNYSYYGYYEETADAWATPATDAWVEAPEDWWSEIDSIGADTLAFDSAFPPPALPDYFKGDSSVVDSVADEIYWDGYNNDDGNPYEEYYAADQEIKRQLASSWAQAFAAAQFEGNPEESILVNRSYLASLSDDALVSAWIPDFEAIYTSLLPELREFGSSSKLFNYYGSLQLGLFADKEGFKLKSDLQIADDMAKRFKRMYNRKLNRKFLNYINSDEAIGFFALAMNTQAYLEELPVLMKDTYGSLFSVYEDDINLATAFISLIIDEKAIAKVAKGDALFVLNGLAEQEVPYTAYEYDDDYNYYEVEKTKMEVIPDFLFMFSSDDVTLYNQIITYAVRKGYLVEENGVYILSNPELPFELLFTRKNGIVFIGTSANQLTAIAANKYRGKLDRQSRNLLTKNKFAGLLSARKLATEIPTEQLASLDRYIAFHKMFGSMGDFYFKSNGIKGNRVSGEFVAQTPAGFDNAIQYLFALIDYAVDQR